MRDVLAVVIGLALLAGCGPTVPAAPAGATPTSETAAMQPHLVRADLPRATPTSSAEDRAALVEGATALAFDLYRQAVADVSGNLIFSPYSVSLAFSLPYAGARGETERQMAATLRFLPQDRHHAAFNALDQHLASLSARPDPGGAQGDAFALTIANGAWGQQGFPFESAYLETLARFYGAGLSTIDFGQSPQAAEVINRWVAEQTAGRITSLVPPRAINPNTRLVLVNAIAFKASWLFPFDASQTENGAFTRLDGTSVTAPLMHGVLRVPYAEDEAWQAVSLPYVGRSVEMLVILPRAGQFAAVEGALSAEMLRDLRARLEERDVTLTLPRWRVDSNLDLKALLTRMGLTAPFGDADLSGISPRDLWIDAALHRGTITVDEQGTEAAAATAIAIAESALPPATFRADHPFIYAILERETGALLFLGRVMDPTA